MHDSLDEADLESFGLFTGHGTLTNARALLAADDAHKLEFKPLFASKQDAFWVTLWNMNYEEEVTTGSVGTQDGAQVGTQDGAQVGDQVSAVLKVLGDAEMTSTGLMTALGFSARSKFQQNYLKPALESGYVEMTIPGKPNSRNQKYRRAR